MPGELVPIIIASFFAAIAYISLVLSDNRVKRELINMKADKETIDHLLLQAPAQNNEGSFKWGLVAVALGSSLAMIHVLDLGQGEPMTYALLFIFGGAGLLGHYALKAGEDSG